VTGVAGVWFDVIDAGPLTTLQDRGRPGLAHLGVPPSGALDRPSAALANRLAGNAKSAAVLETTASGPKLRLAGDPGGGVVLVVTGAPNEVSVDGRPGALHELLALRVGQTLTVGRAHRGLRNYLAVRGGFVAEAVLDSRSTDLLSGLGRPAVRAGDRLRCGAPTGPPPAAIDAVPVPAIETEPVLQLVPGPRDDWFQPGALAVLAAARWRVTPQSNRVGMRLEGPSLERCRTGELPPEGLVTGSLQVPPDGQPVLFLNDHPTTGGYPVIGVVTEQSLAAAAQAAPGTTVGFTIRRAHAAQVAHA
jgi:biotin-dependent carboxylase-like uncharacterized protein